MNYHMLRLMSTDRYGLSAAVDKGMMASKPIHVDDYSKSFIYSIMNSNSKD